MSTFDDLKRLTKHSAIYGLGHILSRGIGFLLLPLYTNVLSPAEYGSVALVFTFIAFVNILFLYGLDSAFLRFYAMQEDADGKRRVLSTTFLLAVLTSISFFVLLFLLSEPLSRFLLGQSEIQSLLRMAAGILLLDTLATFPYLLLRMEERSSRFTLYRFINITLNLGLNVLLVAYLKKGVQGVFISNLIASAFTLVILLPVIWSRLTPLISSKLAKELLKFGLPFVPAGLASMTMELIDRYMLRSMKGLETVGIYNAGYKLGLFMLLVVMAFKFAWQPFFLSLGREETRAKKSFAAVLTYFLLASGFLHLAVSFFVDDFVRLSLRGVTVFGTDFWAGTQVVPVILFAYIMMGVYLIFLPGIYLKGKTKFVPLFTGTGAAVNIACNLVFIPRWGMMGAAWATLAGYFAMAGLIYFTVQRFFPVRYQFARIARIVLVAVVLFGVRQWIGHAFISRILLLLLGFPIGLALSGFFTGAERNRIRNLFGMR